MVRRGGSASFFALFAPAAPARFGELFYPLQGGLPGGGEGTKTEEVVKVILLGENTQAATPDGRVRMQGEEAREGVA